MKEQLENLIEKAESLISNADSAVQLERTINTAKTVLTSEDETQFVFQIAELQRGIRILTQMQMLETPSKKKTSRKK